MRLFRAELLKLRTTPRTVVGLVLPLLGIVILGAVGNITSAHGEDYSRTLHDILDVLGFADVIALILGVLVMTWEFRHDTITETFLVEPRRERVIGAKTAAAMLTGALIAAAAAAVALGIAAVWIGGDAGVSFDSSVWERALRQLPSSALFGAIGVGLGAIVRGQALAIVLAFVWFLIVEPLVGNLYDQVGRYLPGQVLSELAGASGNDVHVAVGPAVVLSIAYTLAIVGAGAFLTLRRDVT